MNCPTHLIGRLAVALTSITLSAALAACDSDATPAAASGSADATSGDAAGADSSAAAFELIGTWTTNFATEEVITAQKWGPQALISFDNAGNVAYTQNPPDDKYGPNKFSKQVWTEPKGDVFYYCTVDFGKDSLDLAKASTLVADDKDPANSGCGGFGWTKMTKKK